MAREQLRGPFRRRYVLHLPYEHHPAPGRIAQFEPTYARTGVPLKERDVVVAGCCQERHRLVAIAPRDQILPALLLKGLPDVVKAPPNLPFPRRHAVRLLSKPRGARAPEEPYSLNSRREGGANT